MGIFGKGGIAKHYDLKEVLGTGNFGVTKLAIQKSTGKKYACKIIKKNVELEENLQDEVNLLRQLDHPNINKLIETFDTSGKFYMVLELLQGGELFDRIVEKGTYKEPEACKVVVKLVNAIEYAHSQGIVHRDLKPENIMYESKSNDSEIKLIDWGLAKQIEGNQRMETICGTPGYVAPEVLKNNGYGKESDLWGCGVILYILLSGIPPFYDESTPALFQQIMRGQYDFPKPYWDGVSHEARDLVKRLLNTDPQKRFTAVQVRDHPWVKKHFRG